MRTNAIMKRAFLGPAQQRELAHKPANLLALIYPNRGKKANAPNATGLHFRGTLPYGGARFGRGNR
jgi:hypothetical protein